MARVTTPMMQWTGDAEADRLISEDPAALLIGFCLDQQVPVEWAFMGPRRIRERLGTVNPTEIAKIDPARVEAAFRTPPALHRYPASMAKRVHALCSRIADDYGGGGCGIWAGAAAGRALEKRFAGVAGVGSGK